MKRPFRQALQDYMDARGVNASEIAHRLKVSPGTVSRWLSVDRGIEAQHLLALGRVLNVDPYDLYDGSFKEPLPPRVGVRPGRKAKGSLPLETVASVAKGPRAVPLPDAAPPSAVKPLKKPRPQAE